MAGAPYSVPMSFSDDETIMFTVEWKFTDGALYPLNLVSIEFVVNDDNGREVWRLAEGDGISKNAATGLVDFNAITKASLSPGRYSHGCRVKLISTGAYQQIWDGELQISEGQF